MATKPKAPKFFEVTVKVPMVSLKDAAASIVESLNDDYDLDLKVNEVLKLEGIEDWLRQYAAGQLRDIAEDLDMYEAAYEFGDKEAKKFFGAEIKAAQEKAELEELMEQARQREIEASTPATVFVKVPKAQLKEATKRLKELGFTVA